MNVQPVDGKKFDYRELQKAVGGLIESIIPNKGRVNLDTGRVEVTATGPKCSQVWANEEGLLLGLSPNPFTPVFANMEVYRCNGYGPGWRVAGNAIAVYSVEKDAAPTYPVI